MCVVIIHQLRVALSGDLLNAYATARLNRRNRQVITRLVPIVGVEPGVAVEALLFQHVGILRLATAGLLLLTHSYTWLPNVQIRVVALAWLLILLFWSRHWHRYVREGRSLIAFLDSLELCMQPCLQIHIARSGLTNFSYRAVVPRLRLELVVL